MVINSNFSSRDIQYFNCFFAIQFQRGRDHHKAGACPGGPKGPAPPPARN